MRLMAYTRKHPKTGMYWYRRAVPPRLRSHLPPVSGFRSKAARTEYTKSLDTRDLRQANRKAGEIDQRVQAALDQAQAALDGAAVIAPIISPTSLPTRGYTRHQLRSAIIDWHREQIERAEAEIIGNPPADPEQAAAAEMDRARQWWSITEPGRHLANPDLYPAISEALASRGMSITPDHPALRHVADPYAILAHYLHIARHHMLRGEWREVDDMRAVADEWMSETTGPNAPPTAPAPKPDPRADKPFLASISDWQATLKHKKRQVTTHLSDVRSFAEIIDNGPISAVDHDAIQRWIAAIQDSGLSAKTARRKLSALSGYWKYLRHKGDVPRGDWPGRGVTILPDARSPDQKRRSFSPADVVRLWTMAANQRDHTLAHAIQIAAYTGARIESIFQITVGDIAEIEGIPFARLSDKTEAGIRSIPIHTAIQPLIARLAASPQPGGYLMPGKANQHGERSHAVGKRFGHLRTTAGFDGRFVYHSIRKTVASMLRVANVSEADTAQMLGHEYKSMSYGVYADDLAVPYLSAIIERAIRYPKTP